MENTVTLMIPRFTLTTPINFLVQQLAILDDKTVAKVGRWYRSEVVSRTIMKTNSPLLARHQARKASEFAQVSMAIVNVPMIVLFCHRDSGLKGTD